MAIAASVDLHGAAELGDHAVAGAAEDAPVPLRDELVSNRPRLAQRTERALLIRADEPTEACHIGCQNGGELASHGRPGTILCD